MSMRFDGRVAIVTGAGNGLGRQYALDLARRGCKVVVNDLGGSTRGDGSSHSAADKVVEEIKAAGGEAVANYDSVVEGAKIVKTAIDAFKRVDIVINNAGILRDVSFAKMSEPDWKLLQNVHLDGAYAVTKAAWPHMRENKFGRVLMVTSAAGLFGNFGQAAYSAVKMGLVGFANTLALEGAKSNILVNVIAPIAGSRMTETVLPPDLIAALKPEYISPLVQFLTHESCKQNGGVFEVGAGWVSRVRYERSAGVFFPVSNFAIEDVAKQIGQIGDFSKDATYPTSGRDVFPALMDNIERSKNAPAPKPAAAGKKTAAGKKNPNVDLERALANKMDSLSHTYTERDVALYALGIGAAADPLDKSELKFVYEMHEQFQTFPTFGVVVPSAALNSVASVPGLTFNPMMLLHGEQFMELRGGGSLPTSGTLTSYPRIAALYDKGSGALMILQVSTKDSQGREVLFNEYSLFIRGLGGFGGDKGPKAESNEPPANTPPEVVHREKTLDNQALLYRLSGDTNPLHADPDMAKQGNFSAPILHGLCSFGYAARAVIKHFAGNDGRRFKNIRARFVSPVYPGETLVTEMWRSGSKVLFRVRVAERGVYAISGGAVELLPDPNAKVVAAPAAGAASSSHSGTGFAAEHAFAELEKAKSADLVKKVNAIFRFDITKGSEKRSWLLDLKNGSGAITAATESTKAECVIAISDDDFVQLLAGKLDAQKAFMQGKIRLKGNMMAAQKLQHLPKPGAAKPAAAAPSASASSGFAAEKVFAELEKQKSADLVKKVNSIFRFDVTKGSEKRSWLLDLKNGSGAVSAAKEDTKADCIIAISDEHFVQLMSGKLNAQQAFMKGQIRIKGNMLLAQKLQLLQPPKAKL